MAANKTTAINSQRRHARVSPGTGTAARGGSAPEVLSRTFRRLEDDGVLKAEPHRVTVLSPERLRALAEWLEKGREPSSKPAPVSGQNGYPCFA
jgi:hypothetical protein